MLRRALPPAYRLRSVRSAGSKSSLAATIKRAIRPFTISPRTRTGQRALYSPTLSHTLTLLPPGTVVQ